MSRSLAVKSSKSSNHLECKRHLTGVATPMDSLFLWSAVVVQFGNKSVELLEDRELSRRCIEEAACGRPDFSCWGGKMKLHCRWPHLCLDRPQRRDGKGDESPRPLLPSQQSVSDTDWGTRLTGLSSSVRLAAGRLNFLGRTAVLVRVTVIQQIL